MSKSVHDFSVATIQNQQQPLTEYRGKVLLIVNTASKCGFTPQFKGLEQLFEQYREKGLMVLGFPCNQFMNQDPASNAEISEFCELNYGVTFPMMAKIDVNGPSADPLFKHLTKESPGMLGIKMIKWNFTKFLVDREGRVVQRYAPTVEPKEIAEDIEKLLG